MALTDGLVAYYSFDENTGTLVNDRSNNGNSGMWTGSLGSQWLTKGKINSAGVFNGNDSYINVPDSASVEFTGDFSISVWLNPSSTQSAFFEVIRKESLAQNNGYGIEQKGVANSLVLQAGWKNSTGNGGWGTDLLTLTASVWNHVVITKSGTTLKAYLNGTLQTTVTGTNGATIDTSTAALQMGNWTQQSNREYKGVMDEVGFWNRSLVSFEVAKLYNNGSGLPYPFVYNQFAVGIYGYNPNFQGQNSYSQGLGWQSSFLQTIGRLRVTTSGVVTPVSNNVIYAVSAPNTIVGIKDSIVSY